MCSAGPHFLYRWAKTLTRYILRTEQSLSWFVLLLRRNPSLYFPFCPHLFYPFFFLFSLSRFTCAVFPDSKGEGTSKSVEVYIFSFLFLSPLTVRERGLWRLWSVQFYPHSKWHTHTEDRDIFPYGANVDGAWPCRLWWTEVMRVRAISRWSARVGWLSRWVVTDCVTVCTELIWVWQPSQRYERSYKLQLSKRRGPSEFT